MLASEPLWTAMIPDGVQQWYEHAHLLDRYVVGQWFGLDRRTGFPVWKGAPERANSVVGVHGETIVATEMQNRGAVTITFGAWGISAATGKQTWEALKPAPKSGFGWVLDKLGMWGVLENAVRVDAGVVVCESGVLLDAKTGARVREELFPPPKPSGPDEFYDGNPYKLSTGQIIQRVRVRGNPPGRDFGFFTRELDGTETLFGIDAYDAYVRGDFYSFRLAEPFVYVIAHDRPKPPAACGLLTVDLRRREVVQHIPLGAAEKECRFEDVDERGVLISWDNRELTYVPRVRDGEARVDRTGAGAPPPSVN